MSTSMTMSMWTRVLAPTRVLPHHWQENITLLALDLSENEFALAARDTVCAALRVRPMAVPNAALVKYALSTWMTEQCSPAGVVVSRVPPAFHTDRPRLAGGPEGSPPAGRFVDRRGADGALTATVFLPKLDLTKSVPPLPKGPPPGKAAPGMPPPPPSTDALVPPLPVSMSVSMSQYGAASSAAGTGVSPSGTGAGTGSGVAVVASGGGAGPLLLPPSATTTGTPPGGKVSGGTPAGGSGRFGGLTVATAGGASGRGKPGAAAVVAQRWMPEAAFRFLQVRVVKMVMEYASEERAIVWGV